MAPVKVTFKTVQGNKFELELDSSDKIENVKQKIEGVQGADFPAANQVIIYQGKVLKDDTTLEENKITHENFVVVMIQRARKAASPKKEEPAAPTTTAPAPAEAAPTAPAAEVPAQQPRAAAVPAAAAAAPAAGAAAGDLNSNSLLMGTQLESTIAGIVEMGFDREEVVRAMRAAFNNPDRAVEYLMTGIPNNVEAPAPAPGASPAAGAVSAAPAAGTPATGGGPASGPNAQPLDMFAPQAPAGAGGAGGAAGPLDFLRSNPQFIALRQIVQSNPMILQPMLQELGKQNPELLTLINANQQEFLRIINEPPSVIMFWLTVRLLLFAALPPGAVAVHLTEEEQAAIQRLETLGFDRNRCIEAFLLCERDETLAANFLFDSAMDE
ncbi:UV excision repair protein Rad23 [Coccomyxa subellipsoidea C-169]|uniref:Ubiquitin receptor RAD23 n=1 Tax=Coccomyxa subellipsoidea (strain C-169) TaxID=574566 RepID=I0YT39_COCSC|nr:UV excision repair protein Rad23 [Coccomyxa subellipsoidea C-169]EIE21558.1 UV excision repair protein Rad23 [Coccomyxa subellipsoidea C-169]|eukprot:XP_005646102.1 UV excision repair protein Rad23 [Coccomyxa subellipsoidea C-169]